ncbi:uracil-DNA glycosylase [Bacillus sp. FJAT-50079]|uniref:uracil-DNA glycosylase n=1 Tax=Bacillus sp. FJAT-50079 TaxID=2833577 RepID=UPI001BCA3A8E|nr:uracil-DNA glycosylase [Bacillus sp. FJAT-50079]MBS4209875.1 uracil-DNA glycosylase [Bacillus sp. FJAT-50079]
MSDFCAQIWPEEPTPEDLKSCRECGLYKHGSRMVWGEGNPEAPIMLILDNPGAREDSEGNPYVCGTRQTLQRAVNDVGLQIPDLYVTFILKRRPTRAYEKERVRQICMIHLDNQIEKMKPKLILCLGNVAVKSFFKNSDADVKTMRQTWHNVRGYETSVAYHPLAVRRRPNLWNSFLSDLKLVAERYEQLH